MRARATGAPPPPATTDEIVARVIDATTGMSADEIDALTRQLVDALASAAQAANTTAARPAGDTRQQQGVR